MVGPAAYQANRCSWCRIGHGERLAGLEGTDARELPSTDDLIHDSAGVGEQPPSSTDRQFVGIAHLEGLRRDVGDVAVRVPDVTTMPWPQGRAVE
jgi:hypothetical protein